MTAGRDSQWIVLYLVQLGKERERVPDERGIVKYLTNNVLVRPSMSLLREDPSPTLLVTSCKLLYDTTCRRHMRTNGFDEPRTTGASRFFKDLRAPHQVVTSFLTWIWRWSQKWWVSNMIKLNEVLGCSRPVANSSHAPSHSTPWKQLSEQVCPYFDIKDFESLDHVTNFQK